MVSREQFCILEWSPAQSDISHIRVCPGRKRMGGKEGSRIKGEAEGVRNGAWKRGVGEERRRIDEKGKGGEASLPQQFSKVDAIRARRPAGQFQPPGCLLRWQKTTLAMCCKRCSLTYTPRMQYILC